MKRLLLIVGLVLLMCGADKGGRADARRPEAQTRPAAQSKPAAEERLGVPPIGHVLGVHVGADSIAKLEKLHGRGLACLGEAPGGGRLWKNASWVVYANGIEAGPAGTVISEIVMGDPGEVAFPVESKKSKSVPSLEGRKKAIFAGLYPGIAKSAAAQLLAAKKWTVAKDGEDLMLRMGGLSTVGKDVKFSDWEARLVFRKDRLVQVVVRCWQAK
jgi:hypothetical protein